MDNKDKKQFGNTEEARDIRRPAGEDNEEVMDVIDPEDENQELEEAVTAEQDENDKLQKDLEDLNNALAKEKEALEKEKKEYMFLMAEFDNFRKRTIKEKAEILRNGAEKVLSGLLPIVDDFERGLAATADNSDANAIREGMELIYNKLIKYLDANGVKAIDSTGKDFDADYHEAIATIPAPTPDLKGKVVDTTQKGYLLNDKVLRHAKVAVGE